MQTATKSASAPEKRTPRYRVIAEAIRAAIRDGRYPVGTRLPTEEEFCAIFDASRQTLREALREVTDEGLILRRPRAGSVVIARQTPTAFTQSFVSIDNLLNYPAGTVRRTIGTDYLDADQALAATLRCAPGTALFRISALRIAQNSDLPLCWTDIYLPPKFAGVVKHRRHELVTVADQIAELYGEAAVRAEVEIAAGEVPARFARRLAVPTHAPALVVTRRYASATGEILETTVSVHPAQRYSCRFEFRRETPRPRPQGKSSIARNALSNREAKV